jgi:hypothetical protein
MLETIIADLEEKHFIKQAILLRSKYKDTYIKALVNKHWEKEIRKELGNKLYSDILNLADNKQTEVNNARIYTSENLTINAKSQVSVEAIIKILKINQKLTKIKYSTTKLIFNEVKEYVKNDEERLYNIFKDEDIINEALVNFDLKKDYEKINQKFKDYQENVSETIKRINTYISQNITLEAFLGREIKRLKDYFPSYNSDLENVNPEELKEYYSNLLKNKKLYQENFILWLKNKIKNRKSRVIQEGEMKIEHFCIDYNQEYHNDCLISIKLEDIMDSENVLLNQATEKLLKSDLSERQDIYNDFKFNMKKSNDFLIGIKQIISGGKITNHDVSPESTMQNHANIPNIKYSKKVITKLKTIVGNMDKLFDELPDISDIGLSSKLRKKKSLDYFITELPKNPLDVTFGNDSGCCINISNDLKELNNGRFVPSYIYSENIRLFGIYRVSKESKKRIGIVLAFETKLNNDENKRILACNSLEISQFGIVGGKNSIEKIVEFVESNLIDYAKKYDYQGIVMGAHDYNTSQNFSNRINNIVKDKLIMNLDTEPFYSDILDYNKNQNIMIVSEKSCYWLWKK